MGRHETIITSDGKESPLIWGPERDNRTDAEKLAEAARDVIQAATNRSNASGRMLDLMQDRFDNAEAEFVRLIEDTVLVPYDLLATAFSLTKWSPRS
jgi:hypothetical protein